MSNQVYQFFLVTAISPDDAPTDIIRQAHKEATSLFEASPELVSALTPIGHNFVQSFCVFPTGSSRGRDAQVEHSMAMNEFAAWLKEHSKTSTLQYVFVFWDDGLGLSPQLGIHHDSDRT